MKLVESMPVLSTDREGVLNLMERPTDPGRENLVSCDCSIFVSVETKDLIP